MRVDRRTVTKMSRLLVFLALLMSVGCGGSSSLRGPVGSANSSFPLKTASQDYLLLLAKFPEDHQGEGLDLSFGTFKEQPMTYGLVLTSEALRFRASPTEEGRRRVRKAVRWLLDNSDLDHDGKPGWGYPDAWDAFADGSVNPANHPYTITTAIGLSGLLDALSLPNFWTLAEREEIRVALTGVSLRWCREVWQETASGGYFWYSPVPVDNIFVTNVSATLLGDLSRVLTEQRDALSVSEANLVQDRVRAAARMVVSTAQPRMGNPFWLYHERDPISPNDLVHHIYTLWGMELYRSSGVGEGVPWTTQQAIASVDAFWRDGIVHDFPQDVTYVGSQAPYQDQPAFLSGTGSMLAFYVRWSDVPRTTRCFNYLVSAHGPLPDLHIWPLSFSNDTNFYPRVVVAALWGIALRDFNWAAG